MRKCLDKNNNVAMEGFFDSIKSLFNKETSFTEDDVKYVGLRQEVIETIKKTFTNKDWVSKNIKNPSTVKISLHDLRQLIVNFKLLDPATALDVLYKKYDESYSKYSEILKKFDKEQSDALVIIEEFYKKNKDVNKVEKFGMDLISKIQVPKVPSSSNFYNRDNLAKNKKIAEDNSETTYSLSVDEIVKLSNKIIDLISFIKTHSSYIVRGSGYDEDFWGDYQSNDDAGEKIRTGKLGDFFYEQGLPEELNDSIGIPEFELEQAIYTTLKIIIKSVNVKHDFKD